MLTDKKLLRRAAWITLTIALGGVAVLYAVIQVADAETPVLLERNGQVNEKPDPRVVRLAGFSVSEMTGRYPDYAEISKDLEFIDKVFPLVSSWELEQIQPFLAPETRDESIRGSGIREVMTVLAGQLGNLESWERPVPGNKRNKRNKRNKMTSTGDLAGFEHYADASAAMTSSVPRLQEYSFVAEYERGLAEVILVLKNIAGRTTLYAFRIEALQTLSAL